jgi:hypothetical protein
MKFAVIARDPQVDLCQEDDFYGVEIVEAANKDEAERISWLGKLQGLLITCNPCSDKMPLGNCDLPEVIYD